MQATPAQPPNTVLPPIVAVSVSVEPTVKLALQVLEQALMPAGVELTVPLPRPVLVTVMTRVSIPNAAPTLCGLFGMLAIVHVGLVPNAAQAPLHPVKIEPVGTAAVSVTLEATLKVPWQVAPQLMPAGVEVTVPVPAPDFETVIVLVSCVKDAVTACAPPAGGMLMTQVVAVPVQAPLQPAKLEPAAGVSWSVTEELLAKLPLHALPQLMLPGLPAVETTVPLPVPPFATVTDEVLGGPTGKDCGTCGAGS